MFAFWHWVFSYYLSTFMLMAGHGLDQLPGPAGPHRRNLPADSIGAAASSLLFFTLRAAKGNPCAVKSAGKSVYIPMLGMRFQDICQFPGSTLMH